MRQGGAALAAREAPSIFRGGPIVARRRLGPRFERGRPRRCRAQDPDDAPRAAQLRGRAAERATDTAQEPPRPGAEHDGERGPTKTDARVSPVRSRVRVDPASVFRGEPPLTLPSPPRATRRGAEHDALGFPVPESLSKR